MSGKIIKSTTLEGYYATGDSVAFCFDRHNGPIEHDKTLPKHPWPEDFNSDDCRVYPGELLPEGTRSRRGRWTITVEFEPFEGEKN